MEFRTPLLISAFPSVLLFLLSLVSIILNAHYWILGDWIMGKWIRVADVATMTKFIDIVIEYVDTETNATIVALSLSFATGILGFIAWTQLRRSDYDNEYNESRRRFYTGSTMLMSLASFCASLVALIFHYTKQGNDKEYKGCSSEFRNTENWILYCTREAGACNVLEEWHSSIFVVKNWAAALACREAKAVKWLLIPIMLCDVAIFTLIGMQAWNRRKTRYQRVDGIISHGKDPVFQSKYQ
ncbi:hypothetical protein BDV96DRAFT_630406 [Lophiotrema nucula]|uniref:Uncharacterized protein n=1 Tax=Lophiotrema nucula TaxID=690887 RepID=A0A6A5ZGP9_9PLEO|nr:hypothetical protein BDV96DRAFT_630406 [Lophiotrema nucula]